MSHQFKNFVFIDVHEGGIGRQCYLKVCCVELCSLFFYPADCCAVKIFNIVTSFKEVLRGIFSPKSAITALVIMLQVQVLSLRLKRVG